MGACTVLGFGALEGIGCCWVLGFLRVLLGSALWASWVLPLYTPCVLRGALRFFNEIPITYQKKKVFCSKKEDIIRRKKKFG
jgi:hypothetical protein